MNWFLQNHKYRAKLTNSGKLLNKAAMAAADMKECCHFRKKKPPAFTSGHHTK